MLSIVAVISRRFLVYLLVCILANICRMIKTASTSHRKSLAMLLLPVLVSGLLSWGGQLQAQSEPVATIEENSAEEIPEIEPCETSTVENEAENSAAMGPGEVDCEPSSLEPLSSQDRQELSDEVSENTQSALTLKRLLLGRSYTFFARVEPEYATYFDGILQDDDGFNLRRLRAGMIGVLRDNLSYKAELDLTDGFNSISDFYLRWESSRFGAFLIGNQKVAQNLSAMTGSLSLLFMERPLPVTSFSLSRRLSVSQDFYFKRFGVHGVFFTRDPNNNAGKYGASLRVITNQKLTQGGLGHLGFSLVHEKMDRDARFRTHPESRVTDIRLVDTGNFQDVDYQSIAGVEIAGARGPYTIRAEGFVSKWHRADSKDNRFLGAYAEIGHFLTGQEFRYRDGKFVRPLIEEGIHAWEVGLRASWVDLNDEDVRGGEQKNLGAALNWYPRGNIRAMFNIIYYKAERDEGDEKGWIAQTRVQLNW